MQNLSISMHAETTKKHFRSNIKNYIYAGCVVLLAIIAFQVWITRDTVSSFHSNEIVASIQVFKHAGSIEQLNNSLGNATILGPLTLNSVIKLSDREFALHLNELGQISEITVDIELSGQEQTQLEQMGIYSITSSGRTLISLGLIKTFNEPGLKLTVHALNPFFDGKIYESNRSGWLSIHKKGLTLHGFGEKSEIRTELSVPMDTSITAMISSTSAETDALNQLSVLISTPLNSIVSNLSSPWKLVVSSDENDNLFYSLLIESVYELEELAEVAKYISSFASLSTTALTLEDKTIVSEIRSSQEPTISITTEQDTHFLHISQGENELHLTQTPSHLLITNHDTSPSLENIETENTCKSGAHTFIELSSLIKTYKVPSIITYLDLVAVNNNSIFFCW